MKASSAMFVLVSGLLALSGGGCGYNQSGGANNPLEGGYRWNSLFREDVQTVAVPVFTNVGFHRGLELRLTQAVIRQLEAQAPYKVVPLERADTVLEGQLTAVTTATLDRDFQTNLPREQRMTLSVDLLWKDLRSGRILVERKSIQQDAVYFPSLGEGQFAGLQQAIERLAMAIVQELQADW